MNAGIARVHGHSVDELCQLVNDVWQGEDTLTLDHKRQGGWDSISLHARTLKQHYILKMPALKGPYRQHPYMHEYNVMKFLARKGLCPMPVQSGRLNDAVRTPFMIAEYVEGTIPSSLEQMTSASFEMLGKTLTTLSQLHPSGIRSYRRATDYLAHITDLLHHSLGDPVFLPPALTTVADSFEQALKSLRGTSDDFCVWSQKTMHGDLQESNIVLQSNSVLLLDVGSCCVGEPLFDLAYLISQPEGTVHYRVPAGLIKSSAEAAKTEALVPLALASAIGWSIGFVANLERDMIEPNLVTPNVGPRVLAYVNQKMDSLASHLAAADS